MCYKEFSLLILDPWLRPISWENSWLCNGRLDHITGKDPPKTSWTSPAAVGTVLPNWTGTDKPGSHRQAGHSGIISYWLSSWQEAIRFVSAITSSNASGICDELIFNSRSIQVSINQSWLIPPAVCCQSSELNSIISHLTSSLLKRDFRMSCLTSWWCGLKTLQKKNGRIAKWITDGESSAPICSRP